MTETWVRHDANEPVGRQWTVLVREVGEEWRLVAWERDPAVAAAIADRFGSPVVWASDRQSDAIVNDYVECEVSFDEVVKRAQGQSIGSTVTKLIRLERKYDDLIVGLRKLAREGLGQHYRGNERLVTVSELHFLIDKFNRIKPPTKLPCKACNKPYEQCIEGWKLNLMCCRDCDHWWKDNDE